MPKARKQEKKDKAAPASGAAERTARLASRDHVAKTDDQKAVQNMVGRLVDWASKESSPVQGRLRRSDGLLAGDEAWMRRYCSPEQRGLPWTRAMWRVRDGDAIPAGYEQHTITVRAGDGTFSMKVVALKYDASFRDARVYYEHAWALGVPGKKAGKTGPEMWDGAVTYGGKSDDFGGRLWAGTPSGPQEKYHGYLSQGAHKHAQFVLLLLAGMGFWVRAARLPEDISEPKVIESQFLHRYKYMMNVMENGGKRYPAWLINMETTLFGTRSGEPMLKAMAAAPEQLRKDFKVPFTGVVGRNVQFKHDLLPAGYKMPEAATQLAIKLGAPVYTSFIFAVEAWRETHPEAAAEATEVVAEATEVVAEAAEAASSDEAAPEQEKEKEPESWVAAEDDAAPGVSKAEQPAETKSKPKGKGKASPKAKATPDAKPEPKASAAPAAPAAVTVVVPTAAPGPATHFFWPGQQEGKCAAFPKGKEHVCGYKAANSTRFCRRHEAWIDRWAAAPKTPVEQTA